MREIKFRGRDICTGEWIYGDLRQRVGCLPSIIHSFCNNGKLDYCETPIHRDSLSQFTGLYDKNGKEIYEGDIIGCYNPEIEHLIFYNDKREFERFEVIDNLQEFFADKSIIDGQCRIVSLTFLYTSVKIENRGKEA